MTVDIGWAVHIEVPELDGPATDDAIGELLELLKPHDGTVSCAQDWSRYGSIFSLYGERDGPEAAAAGAAIFTDFARTAGLPSGSIVRLELMTFAEQDADLGDS